MGTRRVIINGREQIDPRQTRAWTVLRDRVVREEPTCWLRLPCCTGASQTADHILTVSERPELAMVRDNLRGVCGPCNRARGDTPIEQMGVTGPLRCGL